MKFDPIGFLESCFKEKFGIPRQSGLAKSAQAVIRLSAEKYRNSLDGLEGFSHIWVIFVFHEAHGSKLLVRPPRLGGAKKIGVFASRSPHRPNPIGISAVELDRIELKGKDLLIHIRGVDLLDGTPVLDIKPYIPYADSIPRALSGWADSARPRLKVSFTRTALAQCRGADPKGDRKLKQLIAEILREDPRPAFQREDADYAFRLAEFDVHWVIEAGKARVTELKSLI
jgi:tRNA-Thr(GGU) m(6)t(6)A37 methyltransferase TsaA